MKVYDADNESDYLRLEKGGRFHPRPENLLVSCCYDEVELDRAKARELTAILTHFADTGELPNDEGGG